MDEIRTGVIVIMRNGAIRRYPLKEWRKIADIGELDYSWAFENPGALFDHLNNYVFNEDGYEAPSLEPDEMGDW